MLYLHRVLNKIFYRIYLSGYIVYIYQDSKYARVIRVS